MPCGLHNSNLEVREWEKGKSRRKRYAALKPYTAHGPYATHGDKKGRHESGTLFMGIEYIQGFYFDRAISLEEFETKYIFNSGGIK